MDENKDIIQIQVKKTPAFTVLKNNSILKTIFLLRKPPPFHTSPTIQDFDEEIMLVGRHPDCNITLEHPSISRYHLRIHSNPSSQMISVIDLSSVHGTWVSGKRIEPGVRVNLKEGDTVKMGGSSRIYELHWVPLSQAFDVDDPFVPAIYSIKEGEEETNQDGKPEAYSLDDDLECLNLLSSDKIRSSPLNKSNPLTFHVRNFLNSSCNDTEIEHLSPSKTDSEIGEIFGTDLGQPPLVSGTMSAIKDSNTLSEAENQSNWSRDNMSQELEQQDHGIIKDDPRSVPNCSKSSTDDTEVERSSPSETGYENGKISTATEAISESEDLSSDDFEPHNHGIIKDRPISVPNCSKSSSDNTEVEHSSPSKTGHENGKISTTTEALSESEDRSSDQFEPKNHVIIKDGPFSMPNCSNSPCDDTEVEHSSPLKTGHEIGEKSVTTGAISESEYLPNWLMDNMSDGSEPQNHEIIKDDMFSAPNCSNSSCDDTEVEHSSPLKKGHEIGEKSVTTEAIFESEYLPNWLMDNMSDEFEPQNHEIIKDNAFAAPNCSNSSFDDTEVEHSCPLETGHEICEKSTTTEAISNWWRDNMSEELELLGHAEHDLVSVALLDAIETDEKDAVYQDVTRGSEIEMYRENEPVNQQKMDTGSVPVALFNGVNRDEDGSFIPDEAGDNAVTVGFELEQIHHTKMMDEFTYAVLFDAVDSKVDNEHDITEKESVFVANPDGTDMDQEQDFTPDVSRPEDVYINLKAMKNASVSTTIFSSSDRSDSEVFSPDKENKDPNACLAKSLKKRWMEDEHKQSNHHTKSKKRWNMVVDTNSFLHSKSLEDLKLLQGLKGTQLYIPELVIRELMIIKCQNDLLAKSMKKASLALKWIDECKMNTRWWIHVDDEILHSSEAEPSVLRTALHLRKEITDRKIIILSNDLTLKIKAMAEGVMCETADEFRRSLVNPFSERFMWVGSSPRGPTWSCVDDDVLRRKYHGCGINTSHGLEGLRLLARITSFR